MKKIAIITPCFFGATFPLVKRWVKDGYEVDYFFLASKTVDINEGVVFQPYGAESNFGEVKYEACPKLFEYINSDYFHLRYFDRPRPFNNVPLFRSLWKYRLIFFDRKFARYINKQHYDIVNLVGQCSTDYYNILLKYIKSPIIVSLHEVVPDLVNKRNIVMPSWFKSLFNSKCNIVVHSQNSYEDLIKYTGVDISRVHLIHFGLFETFKYIQPDKAIIFDLPEKYILFFGVLRPYKGLDLLYKAVSEHRDEFAGYKFVVAGSGYDEYVQKIKDDDAFICINRRITNAELVALISYSLFVVCPYRGVSQSGIPQTSFVFNKPVVATNLNAFKEMMTDGRNCLLFAPEDYNDLERKMKDMINSLDAFVQHVEQFERENPSFEWDHIAKQYYKIFKEL